MIFNESKYIDLTNTPTIMIYFLLKNDEVVYVGQTKNGLYRIYSHYNNKDFNQIYVIPCEECELDYLEDLYIKKYMPKYNKLLNTEYNFSLDRAKALLNEQFAQNFNKCSKYKLRKMIKALNIQLTEFNNILYLSKNDFDLICKHIKLYNEGEIDNEIFNIGI